MFVYLLSLSLFTSIYISTMDYFSELRQFCLSLDSTTESFPFDESTLVFKVGGKIFALLNTEESSSINLKCEPEKAIDLRERYAAIQPGYHMNKKHWNTISFDPEISIDFLKELILHSYELVLKSLPKKVQNELTLKS